MQYAKLLPSRLRPKQPDSAQWIPSVRRPPRPPAPGDYLHDLIKRRTGENYRVGCGCESMVAQMNAWGPAGCRAHLDEIIAKMQAEAQKRPKWKLLASLPGAKLIIRRMVLSAIRKAEREHRS